MNFRKDQKHETEAIIELWKERVNIIKERNANTTSIDSMNISLARSIRDMIAPIVRRHHVYAIIEIQDRNTAVKIHRKSVYQKRTISYKLMIEGPYIGKTLESQENINAFLSDLEIFIRLNKEKMNKIPSGGVSIIISTRNKFFG